MLTVKIRWHHTWWPDSYPRWHPQQWVGLWEMWTHVTLSPWDMSLLSILSWHCRANKGISNTCNFEILYVECTNTQLYSHMLNSYAERKWTRKNVCHIYWKSIKYILHGNSMKSEIGGKTIQFVPVPWLAWLTFLIPMCPISRGVVRCVLFPVVMSICQFHCVTPTSACRICGVLWHNISVSNMSSIERFLFNFLLFCFEINIFISMTSEC